MMITYRLKNEDLYDRTHLMLTEARLLALEAVLEAGRALRQLAQEDTQAARVFDRAVLVYEALKETA